VHTSSCSEHKMVNGIDGARFWPEAGSNVEKIAHATSHTWTGRKALPKDQKRTALFFRLGTEKC
jgi:hypothetical protein